jgi:hypothetical protein
MDWIWTSLKYLWISRIPIFFTPGTNLTSGAGSENIENLRRAIGTRWRRRHVDPCSGNGLFDGCNRVAIGICAGGQVISKSRSGVGSAVSIGVKGETASGMIELSALRADF